MGASLQTPLPPISPPSPPNAHGQEVPGFGINDHIFLKNKKISSNYVALTCFLSTLLQSNSVSGTVDLVVGMRANIQITRTRYAFIFTSDKQYGDYVW